MNLKKQIAVGFLAAVTFGTTAAKAQYAQPQWGTGVYGGMQPCPYPVQVGNGASSYLDEYREVQSNLDREQEKLDRLEKSQRHMADDLEEAKDVINGTVDATYADFIIAHAENQNRCSEYRWTGNSAPAPVPQPAAPPPAAPPQPPPPDLPPPGQAPPQGQAPEGQPKPPPGRRVPDDSSITNPRFSNRSPASEGDDTYAGGANSNLIPITGFTESQWRDVCDPKKKGGVRPTVCFRPPYKALRGRKGSDADCKKALQVLANGSEDFQKFEGEIASVKRRIARLEDEVDRSQKSAIRRSRSETTESGYCAQCEEYARQARQRAQIAGIGTAVIGGLAWYDENRQRGRDRNTALQFANMSTDLGWSPGAFQGTPSSGAGPMLVAAGLAGYLTAGTGAGSYGCATGMNGTGNANGPMGIAGPYGQGPGPYPVYGANSNPFGYPPQMMGPQPGGAMYMPGQGPMMMPGAPGAPFMNNGAGGQYMGYGPGGVPGMPGMPGQPGYYNPNGMPGQPGFYNPNGMQGGQYMNGQYYPYQQGAGVGFNGGIPGVNPMSLQSGGAAAITAQGLQIEAMNLQNRMYGLNYGASMGGQSNQYMYGPQYNQYSGAAFSQFGAQYPQYYTPSGSYLTGNLTIGGSFGGGGSSYYTPPPQVMPVGGGNGVIVPNGTR
jgi:hypothetical protein